MKSLAPDRHLVENLDPDPHLNHNADLVSVSVSHSLDINTRGRRYGIPYFIPVPSPLLHVYLPGWYLEFVVP